MRDFPQTWGYPLSFLGFPVKHNLFRIPPISNIKPHFWAGLATIPPSSSNHSPMIVAVFPNNPLLVQYGILFSQDSRILP